MCHMPCIEREDVTTYGTIDPTNGSAERRSDSCSRARRHARAQQQAIAIVLHTLSCTPVTIAVGSHGRSRRLA
jgi:hypothetical protein